MAAKKKAAAPSANDGVELPEDPAVEPDDVEIVTGYVADYISGAPVRATPEERDAVQVLAKRLVEDYGYPKQLISTHPQYRVRKAPSDKARSYPVDIAVFSADAKTDADLYLVAECKRRLEKEGRKQLELYLDFSEAELGIWFNGESHIYLRKVIGPEGKRRFEELPNIPRFGQRVEDIGLYKRKDLRPASNLKAVFKDLRNHLAGHTTGITRDEQLAQEIVNVLFCKIYDEVNTGMNEMMTFRSAHGEDPKVVRERILELFEDVKNEFDDVFSKGDAISLDAESIVYVVGELQNYCVTEADRDAVGDAFEVFIGPALRGAEGQFFTPRNVVRMIIEILDPSPGEMILDPACGSGGFLIMALEHVWQKLEAEAKAKGWSERVLGTKKRDAASKFFRGIDKDSFLAKVTKAYMAIIGDGRGGVFCEKSHVTPKEWNSATQASIKLKSFDVVITNPPFGTKIKIDGSDVLSQYELGHKWSKDKKTAQITKTSAMYTDQPPQILFLERCLQFLKPGGRLGIVLPEAIFGMPKYEYVITFLRQRTRIRGIVAMPEALFKTSGKGGTHAKVCAVFVENSPPAPGESYDIFMADAKWCGHDSRGNPTVRKNSDGTEELLDDVPKIAQRYRQIVAKA